MQRLVTAPRGTYLSFYLALQILPKLLKTNE